MLLKKATTSRLNFHPLSGDRSLTSRQIKSPAAIDWRFYLIVWFILGYSWVTGVAMFEPELSEIGVCFV